MFLYDLNKNDCAKIIALGGCKEFKKRLLSLGITRDCKFEVKEISVARNSFKINTENNTMVALRKGEAMKIEVERCKR